MDSPANPQSSNYDRALDPKVKDEDLTADEYLRRQGERAKLAIMGAARGVTSAAGSAFSAGSSAAGGLAADYSPLKFVEKRPIVSVAASAALGFVGVFFWNPNRYKKIKHRLQALERKFKQHEKEVVEIKAVAPDSSSGTAKKTAAAGIGAAIFHQALGAVRPILMQKLAPYLQGLTGGDDQHHAGNGHAKRPPAEPVSHADRLDPRL